jgi:hypothetical protein
MAGTNLDAGWCTARTPRAICRGLSIYPSVLRAAKGANLLRDRLHAHGLLNEFLEANDDQNKTTAFVAALSRVSTEAAAAVAMLIAIARYDTRCVKAGIDIVFPDAPPPPPAPPT